MSFNFPLIADAAPAIQVHMAAVIPAFFIGSWLIFFSTKGARRHRTLGALYLALMTIAAVTALFIRELHPGRFSWIHLLIPLTLYGVVRSIWALRRHDIRAHRNAMLLLYFGALVIAGGFTLFPGRLLNRVFFG